MTIGRERKKTPPCKDGGARGTTLLRARSTCASLGSRHSAPTGGPGPAYFFFSTGRLLEGSSPAAPAASHPPAALLLWPLPGLLRADSCGPTRFLAFCPDDSIKPRPAASRVRGPLPDKAVRATRRELPRKGESFLRDPLYFPRVGCRQEMMQVCRKFISKYCRERVS